MKALVLMLVLLGACRSCPRCPPPAPVGPMPATLSRAPVLASWPERVPCAEGSGATLCFADGPGKVVIQYLLDLEAWAKNACRVYCKPGEMP